MSFGSMFTKAKLNKMLWTKGRLERSMKLATESEIARDLCVEILKTDARTHKALGDIDLANVAFNAAKNSHYRQINQAKGMVKEAARLNESNPQSLAQKFKFAALQGS